MQHLDPGIEINNPDLGFKNQFWFLDCNIQIRVPGSKTSSSGSEFKDSRSRFKYYEEPDAFVHLIIRNKIFVTWTQCFPSLTLGKYRDGTLNLGCSLFLLHPFP